MSLRGSPVIPRPEPPAPRARSRNRHRRARTHAANLWTGRRKSTRRGALLLEDAEDPFLAALHLAEAFLRLGVGGIPLQGLREHFARLRVQAPLRVERAEVGVDLGVGRIVLDGPQEVLLGVLLPARIPALGQGQVVEVLRLRGVLIAGVLQKRDRLAEADL